MKARTLVLMLSICMLFFTGFGNTTTDLTDNSKADAASLEAAPVKVVQISEINWEDFRETVKRCSQEAVEETDAKLLNRYEAAFEIADAEFNKIFKAEIQDLYLSPKELDAITPKTSNTQNGEVGWFINKNQLIINSNQKHFKGDLSLFYRINQI